MHIERGNMTVHAAELPRNSGLRDQVALKAGVQGVVKNGRFERKHV